MFLPPRSRLLVVLRRVCPFGLFMVMVLALFSSFRGFFWYFCVCVVLVFLVLDVLWVSWLIVFICNFSMRVGEAGFDSSAKLADWLRMGVSPFPGVPLSFWDCTPRPAYCSAKIQKLKKNKTWSPCWSGRHALLIPWSCSLVYQMPEFSGLLKAFGLFRWRKAQNSRIARNRAGEGFFRLEREEFRVEQDGKGTKEKERRNFTPLLLFFARRFYRCSPANQNFG